MDRAEVFASLQHTTAAAFVWMCGFLIGIALQTFFAYPFPNIFIFGIIVLFGFVLWRVIWKHRILLLLLIGGFGILCGLVRLEVATWNDTHPALEARIHEPVILEGVVVREVSIRAQTAQLILSVERVGDTSIDHKVMVITERFPRFFYGDRVVVEGTLELPDPFETEFNRTFDYPGYLKARDIRYTVPFAQVKRLGSDEGNPILAFLFALKREFMENIEKLLPEPSAGIAEGITLGVKRALGDELETAFRTTGIIHIVVLSGYNVTIVAEGIMRLLGALVLPRTKMIIGILAITAFAIIAGFSPTVVRATLMAGLILYARTTGRTYTTVRALFAAGVIMLCINPHLLIYDPGFQLSFLATIGLIVLAPLIEQRLGLIPTTLQIREFCTATVATQLFVLPLLLFSIGELSVVAVAVNVLVLPAVPVAMFGTFVTGVLGSISYSLALLPAYGTHMLLSYLVGVVQWFADLSFSSFVMPQFSFWYVVLGYAVLTYLIYKNTPKLPK